MTTKHIKNLQKPAAVLALDPGWWRFGWAIYLDGRPVGWGVAKRRREWKELPGHLERDRMIRRVLCEGDAGKVTTKRDTIIVVEDTNRIVHPDKPAKALDSAARIVGHVEAFVARLPNPVYFVSRNEWAQLRSDSVVRQEVSMLTGVDLTDRNRQDEADALGVGHWFCTHKWFEIRSKASE